MCVVPPPVACDVVVRPTAAALMFSINPSSGTPIYMQIADQVRQLALGGRLKAGDTLPSVRTIARELHVNHMTVSKAYSVLRQEGVVTFIRGKGMAISKASVDPGAAIRPQAAAVVEAALRLGLSREDMHAAIEQVWAEQQVDDAVDAAKLVGADVDVAW